MTPPRCKVCKEPTANRIGLRILCSIDCAVLFSKAEAERKQTKVKSEARKNARKTNLAAREQIKTRSDLIKTAQRDFNAYIRARAVRFGHNCISSGRPLLRDGIGGGFDCGHYRSTGSAPHLRFNLNNAWGQSKHDNQYKSGAVQSYRIGLIKMIGIEKVEMLENNNCIKKFDHVYLRRISKIFRKKKRMVEIWAGKN